MRGIMQTFAVPLLLLAGLASAAEPPAPPPSDDQAYQISVNVDLVVLQATVRDRRGQFAPDLQEPNFEVFEDGVRQSIRLFRHEDIPVTVGLLVDHSGSMREKLTEVVFAARTFVKASSPDDEMFVVNFNEHVTVGLDGATPFSNRPDVLANAISSTRATGQTALYDAIVVARDHLKAGSRDKKVLIVISDGGDNKSTHTLEEVLKLGGQSNALVYTVGIFDPSDEDQNPRVLGRLAHTTGGEAYFPGDIKEVVSICEHIAREIRNQYTIGYVSTNAAVPGAHRSIRVVARTAGKRELLVRTRSGYIVSGPSQADKDKSPR